MKKFEVNSNVASYTPISLFGKFFELGGSRAEERSRELNVDRYQFVFFYTQSCEPSYHRKKSSFAYSKYNVAYQLLIYSCRSPLTPHLAHLYSELHENEINLVLQPITCYEKY